VFSGSLCLEEFSEQQPPRCPRILPCGHTFCTKCIGRFQVNECPNDRTAFQQPAQSLPKNFMVFDIIQQLIAAEKKAPAKKPAPTRAAPKPKFPFPDIIEMFLEQQERGKRILKVRPVPQVMQILIVKSWAKA